MLMARPVSDQPGWPGVTVWLSTLYNTVEAKKTTGVAPAVGIEIVYSVTLQLDLKPKP